MTNVLALRAGAVNDQYDVFGRHAVC
jgi:hypothetical protein